LPTGAATDASALGALDALGTGAVTCVSVGVGTAGTCVPAADTGESIGETDAAGGPCQRSTPNTMAPAMIPAAASIPASRRPRFSSRRVSPQALAVLVGPGVAPPPGVNGCAAMGGTDSTVGATAAAIRATRTADAFDESRGVTRDSASARDATSAKRRAGSFSRQRRTMASRSAGASGRSWRRGVGASRMILADTSALDSPS
jgi:hypothetical protein